MGVVCVYPFVCVLVVCEWRLWIHNTFKLTSKYSEKFKILSCQLIALRAATITDFFFHCLKWKILLEKKKINDYFYFICCAGQLQ